MTSNFLHTFNPHREKFKVSNHFGWPACAINCAGRYTQKCLTPYKTGCDLGKSSRLFMYYTEKSRPVYLPEQAKTWNFSSQELWPHRGDLIRSPAIVKARTVSNWCTVAVLYVHTVQHSRLLICRLVVIHWQHDNTWGNSKVLPVINKMVLDLIRTRRTCEDVGGLHLIIQNSTRIRRKGGESRRGQGKRGMGK